MTIITKGMGVVIKKFGKKTATHMQKQAQRHKAWKKMGMKGPKYKIGKKVKGSHHLDEVWTYDKNYKEKAGWGAHLKRRSRVFKEGQKRHKALDIKEGKK